MTKQSSPADPGGVIEALSAPPLATSVDTAAKRIGIGRTKAFNLIGAGRLKAIRCDGRTLVTEAALKDFLASLPARKPRKLK